MSDPQYHPFTEVIFSTRLTTRLSFDDYDKVCAAWESKKDFFDGENEYGSTIRIKLKDISMIAQISHEQRLAMIEEKRAQNKEDEVLGTSD
jgi:hypothetical protein